MPSRYPPDRSGRSSNEAGSPDIPQHALINIIRIPVNVQVSPIELIVRRVGIALVLIIMVALVAYIEKDGYSEKLSFIDALYYSGVTLSTTGYGDIVPVTQLARLINLFVVTPLRLGFVILLVGTTLSVLTEESRKAWQIQHWRKRMRNHTIIIGYGTKGRSAVSALLADGTSPKDIVVVDKDSRVLEVAEAQGLVTVNGSGTQSNILKLAGVGKAKAVVVAPSTDDTAVLVTLSGRE